MKYGISIAQQVSGFLSAVGFGFFSAVTYFIVVFIRETIGNKRWLVIAQDIFFCVLTSFLYFIFLQVYSDGQLRPEMLFASAFGFFVFVFALGKLLNRIIKKASSALRMFLKAFFSPVVLFYKLLRSVGSKIKKNFLILFQKIRERYAKVKKTVHEKSKKKKKTKENKKI